MQELIMIAGPNGAGKTSFANAYLPAAAEGLIYVNADEIAREIAHLNLPPGALDIRAGRMMLERIDVAVAERKELMLETTLASLTYAKKIPIWQQAGYSVALIYLRLANVGQSIERVRRRVEAGGHAIPEDVIRKRFEKSRDYLERIYKPIVDEWYIWESLEGDFALAEAWND
jgi:predicted ABC-type ATPase